MLIPELKLSPLTVLPGPHVNVVIDLTKFTTK